MPVIKKNQGKQRSGNTREARIRQRMTQYDGGGSTPSPMLRPPAPARGTPAPARDTFDRYMTEEDADFLRDHVYRDEIARIRSIDDQGRLADISDRDLAILLGQRNNRIYNRDRAHTNSEMLDPGSRGMPRRVHGRWSVIPPNQLDDIRGNPGGIDVQTPPQPRQGASRHTPRPDSGANMPSRFDMRPVEQPQPIPAPPEDPPLSRNEWMRYAMGRAARAANQMRYNAPEENATHRILSGQTSRRPPVEQAHDFRLMDRYADRLVRNQDRDLPRTREGMNEAIARNERVRMQAEHLYNTGRQEEAVRLMQTQFDPRLDRPNIPEHRDPRQRKQGGRIAQAIAKRRNGGRT